MQEDHEASSHCAVCHRVVSSSSALRVEDLRPALRDLAVQHRAPDDDSTLLVCRPCLVTLRREHMRALLERERGELSSLEAHVSQMAADNVAISSHVEDMLREKLTFAQRLADSMARIGGSWPFVIAFVVALTAWIGVNSLLLRAGAFDPYPYILLNLALSCLAALQAPVIMMSQNRAASRDRLEADEDFKINLKAELEIAALHEKVDHLLHGPYARLVEAQELQIELLEQMRSQSRRDLPPHGGVS